VTELHAACRSAVRNNDYYNNRYTAAVGAAVTEIAATDES